MEEKKKPESNQEIEIEQLEKVTGGANFDFWGTDNWYYCTCNTCGKKWDTKFHRPDYCPSCKSKDITVKD